MTAAADEPSPESPTPYERIGGEPGVRTPVDRFYDLMDLEPAYAVLRGVHGSDLASARDKLFWFLCGWLGGPSHYIERFGHPKLRMRHMPFAIGGAERDAWLACMRLALVDCAVDPKVSEWLMAQLFGTADWMRNKAD